MEDVASLGVDALTSVDWSSVASTGKTGEGVGFGETLNVK